MELVVELHRLILVQRVRPAVPELVEGQRDRAATGARVDQERADSPEHRQRQWQNAAEDSWVDRDGDGRAALPREDLCEQASSGVPDDRWLPVQGGDDLGRVIGDLL